MAIGTFGPKVIGKSQFNEEQATVASMAHIYGPRVVGKKVFGKRLVKNEAGEDVEVASLSVAKVTELVESNPALVQEVFEAELLRPDGARKGALKALQAAEAGKGKKATKALLESIGSKLDEISGAVSEPTETEAE